MHPPTPPEDATAELAELLGNALAARASDRDQLHRTAAAIVNGHSRLAEALGLAIARATIVALHRSPQTPVEIAWSQLTAGPKA